MKRSPMRRVKPLRRTKAGGPDLEREPKPYAVALSSSTIKTGRQASYSGATSGRPVEKEDPLRDQALRDMAEKRPCMLMVPAICNARVDTTVLCHENQGKGMAMKQSDARAVWGCAACHEWYDRSGAPREQKRATFSDAHGRQALAYGQVAADPGEPERFRRAARRALERLRDPS